MTEQVRRVTYGDKEILLIPTAHVSEQSVRLVKQVIEQEHPDSVCIELDDKRYETIKNPKAWEDTDIIQVIKTKRVGFMLVNLVLSAYQKKIAKQLNTVVGGEMIQAMESAEKIDAQIVLADRDIQTTFLRIWRKLGLIEKFKLLFGLLFSFEEEEELDEESFKELMQNDMLESVLADMKKEYPIIGEVLINERDRVLASKIKTAPGSKIVAVLGGAHVPGVMKAIDMDVDVKALQTVPPKSSFSKIAGWIIPLLILGLLAYAFVHSVQTGLNQLSTWILWNSCLAALFTLLALGHPLSIITSFIVAPFSSLNPFLAVGWFTGLVQASIQKPTVHDLHTVQTDIFSIKGFFKNKLLKVLFVVIMANIGSSIGTFIAGADIIRSLF